MNKKFLIIIALIGIFAVLSVSAADVDNSTLDNGTKNITLDGINFTIPEGFSENVSLRSLNKSNDNLFIHYTTNSKTYENGTVSISMLVAVYDDAEMTDEIVSTIGGQKTTINGVNGYLGTSKGYPTFSYEKDNKLATVASNDPDIFSKVIV